MAVVSTTSDSPIEVVIEVELRVTLPVVSWLAMMASAYLIASLERSRLKRDAESRPRK
jgi:hypothetical protein